MTGRSGGNEASRLPRKSCRVLHIAQKLPGGIAVYLSEVLPFQMARFGDDAVMTLGAEAELHLLPNLPAGTVHSFPDSARSPRALIGFARSALRTIRRVEPDLVHLHSTYAGLLRPLLLLLAPGKRPRVVYCSHGWAFNMRWSRWKRALFAFVERRLAAMTDRTICISRFEYDSARARGLPADNMVTIENGVDASFGPGMVEPEPLPADRLNLLFVGRKDEQKGLDIAMAAMAILQDIPVHLHVVGESVVGGSAQQADSPGNVSEYGWLAREAVTRFIEGADAVLMPSRWEGFGLVAIEAMRQGKPVLASNADALPDVVRDGVSGRIFPAGDPRALADLIRSLDRGELQRLGQQARDEFLERFTSDRMNERIVGVYEAVLKDRGA